MPAAGAADRDGGTAVSDWTNSAYTRCRKDRRELSDIVIERAERIAVLEAENAALRGFVAGDDRIQQLWGEHGIRMSHCPDDMWAALNEQQDRRIALAAEHGLPLPEVGER